MISQERISRIVRESIEKVLSEEVDMGQLDARRQEPSPYEYPQDVKNEIRRLRHLIDDYEKEGKDTSALTNRIHRLKVKYSNNVR